MPRICFVSGNIFPLLANRTDLPIVGGAEVQQYQLAQELAQRGLEVSFVSEDFGQGPDITIDGLRVLAYRLSPNKWEQASTLWRALRLADADIYYVRSLPKHSALIYLFVRRYRRKLVQALASDLEVAPELIAGRLNRLVFRFNALWRVRADAVIAQTAFQAQRLWQRWGIRAESLPKLVPLAAAAPACPEPFTVLWVGTIAPHKKVELALDIARQLPHTLFVIAGGPARGGQAYYDAARAQAAKQANVRWLGYVPHGEIGPLFQRAALLLHTSPQEGFPNVFVEAWAAGVPVITLGINPAGLFTERGLGVCSELSRAADEIERLRAEPDRLSEMGARGRAFVTEFSGPEAVMPLYLRLFDRLMTQRAERGPSRK
ncbi:MAG: glycosyltransferase family 4 protein [Anaerolineales bacterium]